jgi:hypothetical protein
MASHNTFRFRDQLKEKMAELRFSIPNNPMPSSPRNYLTSSCSALHEEFGSAILVQFRPSAFAR